MSSKDTNKLIEPFRTSVKLLIKKASNAGIPILITNTTRTLAEQRELVRKGYSKTMNSKHLTGEAVDIAFLVNDKLSYNVKLYERLYTITKDLPFIIWPFRDLKWNWDWPHHQHDKNKNVGYNDDMEEIEKLKKEIVNLNTEIGKTTAERDFLREQVKEEVTLKIAKDKELQTCLDRPSTSKLKDKIQEVLNEYDG